MRPGWPRTPRGPRTSSASSRGAPARFGRPPAGTRAASISIPTFAPNLAGLGKVAWARGNTELAIERYADVVARYPSAEFVVALADLYATSGRPEPADDQEAVVRAMHDLAAANGVNVDLELALFDADHGDPDAVARGRARRSGAGARSVHVADALAWALYANGRFEEAARLRGPRARARDPQRAVPVPRRDDRTRARPRRARAGPAARRARAEPQLLDPARRHGGRGPRRSWRPGDDPPRPRRAGRRPRRCCSPRRRRWRTRSGNFTVNRYAGIQLAPGQVRVDYVVDMAEIPTVQVAPGGRRRRRRRGLRRGAVRVGGRRGRRDRLEPRAHDRSRARGARGGLGDHALPARAGRARRPAARGDVRRPGARDRASSRSPTRTSRTAWGGARSRRRAPTASR